jgi:hypothetical protein
VRKRETILVMLLADVVLFLIGVNLFSLGGVAVLMPGSNP